jgi:hypothetical protein
MKADLSKVEATIKDRSIEELQNLIKRICLEAEGAGSIVDKWAEDNPVADSLTKMKWSEATELLDNWEDNYNGYYDSWGEEANKTEEDLFDLLDEIGLRAKDASWEIRHGIIEDVIENYLVIDEIVDGLTYFLDKLCLDDVEREFLEERMNE